MESLYEHVWWDCYCPSLVDLNFNVCTGLTNIGISNISNGCPLLHGLSLNSCSTITCVLKFSNMKFFSLSGCYDILDDTVISVAENSPCIEILHLASCSRVTDIGVSAIAEKRNNRLELNLFICNYFFLRRQHFEVVR